MGAPAQTDGSSFGAPSLAVGRIPAGSEVFDIRKDKRVRCRLMAYRLPRICRWRLRLMGRRFADLPIRTKILAGFGLVLLSLIILAFATFLIYRTDKEQSTRDVIRQMNEQTVLKLEDYWQDLNNITKLPLLKERSDESLMNEMEAYNKTRTASPLLGDLVDWYAYKAFSYRDSIQSVFMFNLHGDGHYRVTASSLTRNWNPSEEPWFAEAIRLHGKPVLLSTFVLHDVADVKGGNAKVFSMARALVSLTESKAVGVVLVNNSIEYLANLCRKMLIVPGQRILIIDAGGSTVYDTDEANITLPADRQITDLIGRRTSGNSYARINDVHSLYSFQTSVSTGWRLVNIIPVYELNKNINRMRNVTILMTLLLGVLSLVFVLIISGQIVTPIRKLALLMKQVEKGDFESRIHISGHDEIGELAQGFNNMTREIKILIQEVYSDKIKQKDLELQMLQYQINPHFLYNTLESIHMMAEINHDRETSQMAFALGKLLRYSISSKQEIVTLGEEMQHLELYILLQKNRFDELFRIETDIPPELSSVRVLKLILQPIVENAIYHGLKDRASGGVIRVGACVEEDRLVLRVSDNGKGMSPRQTERLNAYVNDMDDSFTSVGLRNIHKRIRLRYGEPYGLFIESEPEASTTVRVITPLKR